MFSKYKAHAVCIIAVAAVCFLAYYPSLDHSFAWDDHALITDNPNLASDTAARAFLSPFWNTPDKLAEGTRKFYRPIVILSFQADHRLYGYDPRGYHLTNILLHCLCAAFVYLLAAHLLRNAFYAFLAAVIFAIHPVHVESVSWISGRTDLLCALFMIPAIHLFTAYLSQHTAADRKAPSHLLLLGSGVLYLLALLSKETALAFFFIAGAYLAAFHGRNIPWKRMMVPSLYVLSITMAYLIVRMAILGELSSQPMYGTALERMLTIPKAFVIYLGLLMNAVRVDPHHANGLLALDSGVMQIFFMLIALFYILLCIMALNRRHNLTCFLLLWVPAALIPVFNLGTFGDVVVADRFLYIPSIGFCILAAKSFQLLDASVLSEFRWIRKAYSVLMLVFTASLMLVTARYQHIWAKDLSLFSYAAKTSPQSAYIRFNLGLSHSRMNEHESAEACYRKAIGLNPAFKEAMTNLGITLNKLGRSAEALETILKAIGMGDRSSLAYSALADCYRNNGDLDNAVRYYRMSIHIAPTTMALNNIGEALIAAGRPEDAVREFNRLLEAGEQAFILNNLGLAWLEAGGYRESLESLDKAYKLVDRQSDPRTYCMICCNLAKVHKAMGSTELSARYSEEAVKACRKAFPSKQSEDIIRKLQELSAR